MRSRQNACAPVMVGRQSATFIRTFNGRMSLLAAVVGERDPQVFGVAQHLVAVGVDAVQDVDVFGSPSGAALAGLVLGSAAQPR